MRLLVVGECAPVVDMIRRAGHSVDCSADERSGIVRVISSAFYDAIVVDTTLPPFAGDGLDFMVTARRCDPYHGGLLSDAVTAIVALTVPSLVSVAISCGADAVVLKPIVPNELAVAIDRAVHRRRSLPPAELHDEDSMDYLPTAEARELIRRVDAANGKINAVARR